MVIAGILLTIGVPSYQQFIQKNHTVTQTNNLVAVLNLARSEAIKRGVRVTVRRKGTTDEVWDNGWDLFTDLDADGTFDDDADTNLCEVGEDCLLRTYGSLPTNFTLRTGATYAKWVSYLPSGLSKGSGGLSNDTFRLCAGDANTAKSRAVAVNLSGRPRTSTGTALCP